MTVSGTTIPLIKNDVFRIKEDYKGKHRDIPEWEIAEAVSDELISKTAIRAGTSGGITSLPATLPGVGILGTILLGSTADLIYVVKLQIELCYAISFAYDVEMEEEELKAVTLAILGFSGTTMAVKGVGEAVLKKGVDDLAKSYMKRGLERSSAEVAEKLIPRMLGRTYKFIPLLSIPIAASINVSSTWMVGKKAKRYFTSWHEQVESE